MTRAVVGRDTVGPRILVWLVLASDVHLQPRRGVLALALRAFLELMEHGVVSWETLSIPFVRKRWMGFSGGKRMEVVERCQGLTFTVMGW